MVDKNVTSVFSSYCFRPDAVISGLRSALEACDVIVTSGGVSMGEKVRFCGKFFLLYSLMIFILSHHYSINTNRNSVFVNIFTFYDTQHVFRICSKQCWWKR